MLLQELRYQQQELVQTLKPAAHEVRKHSRLFHWRSQLGSIVPPLRAAKWSGLKSDAQPSVMPTCFWRQTSQSIYSNWLISTSILVSGNSGNISEWYHCPKDGKTWGETVSPSSAAGNGVHVCQRVLVSSADVSVESTLVTLPEPVQIWVIWNDLKFNRRTNEALTAHSNVQPIQCHAVHSMWICSCQETIRVSLYAHSGQIGHLHILPPRATKITKTRKIRKGDAKAPNITEWHRLNPMNKFAESLDTSSSRLWHVWQKALGR